LGFFPDAWNARKKGWDAHYWNMDGYLVYNTNTWSSREDKYLVFDSLPYSNWQETRLDALGANCALSYYEKWNEGNYYPSLRLWNFRAGLYDYEYLKKLKILIDDYNVQDLQSEINELLHKATKLLELDDDFMSSKMWDNFLERRNRIAEMIVVLEKNNKKY
jgi:hypothetical protein